MFLKKNNNNSKSIKGSCWAERDNCGVSIKDWRNSIRQGKKQSQGIILQGSFPLWFRKNQNSKSVLLLSSGSLTEGTLEPLWSFSGEKLPPCSSESFSVIRNIWGRSLPPQVKCHKKGCSNRTVYNRNLSDRTLKTVHLNTVCLCFVFF